jgi:hypothetical protein
VGKVGQMHGAPPHPHSRLARARVAAAVVVPVALVLVAVLALRTPGVGETVAVAGDVDASIATLNDDRERFDSQIVRIRGEVVQRYGDGIFALGTPNARDVVIVRPASSVSGTDRRSGRLDVEGRVGTVGEELREALRGDYALLEGRPFVRARRIAVAR